MVSNREVPVVAYFQAGLGGGGATRSNIKTATGLSSKGLVVHFVTGCSEHKDAIDIPSSLYVYKLNFKRLYSSVFPLMRYIRKEKPDVVISGSLHCNIALSMACFFSGVNTRIILTDRVSPVPEIQAGKGFLNFILPGLMRFFYPRADALVSVSYGTAKNVLSLVPSVKRKISVIYNPTVTRDKIKSSYDEVSHPWFMQNLSVITSVGRLAPQKDLVTLISAFSKVKKEMDVKLMIIGEGDERGRLERLVLELGLSNDIEFLGHKENPHPYMRKSDLFVLSSAWEGFGNVLAEAMSYGTPVVSTDCPSGPAEILNFGEYGQLVEVGNVTALAKAIISSIKKPKDSLSLIERANSFNEDKSIDAYAALIDRVLSDSIM